MLPTWVLGFPSGHECGEYLTIDLGGTKLRICWVTLNQGKGENHSESEIYHIPKSYKVGTADQLWSFLAESMEDFMTKRKIEPEEDTVIPLGFTFSYPATQEYIDQGVLQTWTKGFDIKGVEGHDVADQLRQALHQRVGLCIAGIDSYTRLTPAGITNPDRRSHQRHGRRHDRICIQ
jgi:hexokinase